MEVSSSVIIGILGAGYPIVIALIGFIAKRDRDEAIRSRRDVAVRLIKIERALRKLGVKLDVEVDVGSDL